MWWSNGDESDGLKIIKKSKSKYHYPVRIKFILDFVLIINFR